MFDFAWTEIGLIGVVAMILIGPKDMPVAIKAVSDMVKKARRMAGEFQGHVDDMLRDSNLNEVRESIAEIRNMDLRGEITRAVDGDGTLRGAFTDDPFKSAASPKLDQTILHPLGGDPSPAGGSVAFNPPGFNPAISGSLRTDVPAFIPPEAIPAPPPPPVVAPAFIPPELCRPNSVRLGA